MPKAIHKFWNFIAAAGEKPAELILYGDISNYSWWGDEVTPAEFNKELAALGDVSEIIVRINSGGGDVFAANAIYTRLKDHKAKITVKIDGWAASAATIIAMAGDTIMIPANGVFMIHNPAFVMYDYLDEERLTKLSEIIAVIKNSMINAYALKTEKDKDEISTLLSAETWFTGEEAVAAGFCDEVMFGEAQALANVAAFSTYKNVPKALLNLPAGGVANKQTTAPQSGNHPAPAGHPSTEGNLKNSKGEESMELKTLDELKAAYPTLVAQAESAAAEAATKAERERIKTIESVALGGFDELITKAKFDAPVSAEAVAMQMIAAQKAQGGQYLKDREADIAASGMEGVETESGSISAGKADTPKEKQVQAKTEVAALLGKTGKEKK
ncbi:MAG: Clp protease ClpP [Oscillospiraceae bacterium]|nr:Clp protease ClpP [Oscillospiraceae bacterium]